MSLQQDGERLAENNRLMLDLSLCMLTWFRLRCLYHRRKLDEASRSIERSQAGVDEATAAGADILKNLKAQRESIQKSNEQVCARHC